MSLLFTNNASTTLASGITGSSTTLTVKTGDGDLFPSPSGSDYFIFTLISADDNTTNEICYCTSRTDDTLTITRAQEDTSALSWSSGDYVKCVPTAGTMEAFLQDVDDASTSTSGLVQLATAAETITGTNTSKAVTPYGLSQKTASTSVAGLAQFATSAETIAGTLTSKAVTPYGLSTLTATTSRKGLVELATDSDVSTGTNSSLAVTPSTLASRSGSTTLAGLLALATSAEAIAGTNTSKAVSPSALLAALTNGYSSGTGYLNYPTWMGGKQERTGSFTAVKDTTTSVTFVSSFSSACSGVVISGGHSTAQDYVSVLSKSTTGFTVYSSLDQSDTFYYYAWGY